MPKLSKTPTISSNLTQVVATDSDLGILGQSLPIQTLRLHILRYAPSHHTVLIEGESGSGKELVANALHSASHSNDGFFPINCAAIPSPLLETTLFGHHQGAYTGALQNHCGLFEAAGNGTLFLDEVAELPQDVQAKLLRVLENGEYRRIGETTLRHSLARILAASNRNLYQEVLAGRFRADLYHRLNILSIHVPPLRELGQDKHLLLDHFRDLHSSQMGQPAFALDARALSYWADYDFPGNIRELRNLVIRLLTGYPGKVVTAAQLRAELPPSPPQQDGTPLNLLNQTSSVFNLDEAMSHHARHYIASALAKTQGNISIAARLLGIPRSTLCSRMAALDIPRH